MKKECVIGSLIILTAGFGLGYITNDTFRNNNNQRKFPELEHYVANRASELEHCVDKVISKTDFNINWYALLFAVCKAESDFRHIGFKGSIGERGQMQLRKATWYDACKKLKVKWPYSRVWERDKSFIVWLGYAHWMKDYYRGRYKDQHLLEAIIKGYNVGPSAFMRGKEPRITSRYYAKVMRTYKQQLVHPTWQNHREGERIRRAVNWTLGRLQ